jgi:hypothetical protein
MIPSKLPGSLPTSSTQPPDFGLSLADQQSITPPQVAADATKDVGSTPLERMGSNGWPQVLQYKQDTPNPLSSVTSETRTSEEDHFFSDNNTETEEWIHPEDGNSPPLGPNAFDGIFSGLEIDQNLPDYAATLPSFENDLSSLKTKNPEESTSDGELLNHDEFDPISRDDFSNHASDDDIEVPKGAALNGTLGTKSDKRAARARETATQVFGSIRQGLGFKPTSAKSTQETTNSATFGGFGGFVPDPAVSLSQDTGKSGITTTREKFRQLSQAATLALRQTAVQAKLRKEGREADITNYGATGKISSASSSNSNLSIGEQEKNKEFATWLDVPAPREHSKNILPVASDDDGWNMIKDPDTGFDPEENFDSASKSASVHNDDLHPIDTRAPHILSLDERTNIVVERINQLEKILAYDYEDDPVRAFIPSSITKRMKELVGFIGDATAEREIKKEIPSSETNEKSKIDTTEEKKEYKKLNELQIRDILSHVTYTLVKELHEAKSVEQYEKILDSANIPSLLEQQVEKVFNPPSIENINWATISDDEIEKITSSGKSPLDELEEIYTDIYKDALEYAKLEAKENDTTVGNFRQAADTAISNATGVVLTGIAVFSKPKLFLSHLMKDQVLHSGVNSNISSLVRKKKKKKIKPINLQSMYENIMSNLRDVTKPKIANLPTKVKKEIEKIDQNIDVSIELLSRSTKYFDSAEMIDEMISYRNYFTTFPTEAKPLNNSAEARRRVKNIINSFPKDVQPGINTFVTNLRRAGNPLHKDKDIAQARVMLQGPAGTGKTVLMKRLLLELGVPFRVIKYPARNKGNSEETSRNHVDIFHEFMPQFVEHRAKMRFDIPPIARFGQLLDAYIRGGYLNTLNLAEEAENIFTIRIPLPNGKTKIIENLSLINYLKGQIDSHDPFKIYGNFESIELPSDRVGFAANSNFIIVDANLQSKLNILILKNADLETRKSMARQKIIELKESFRIDFIESPDMALIPSALTKKMTEFIDFIANETEIKKMYIKVPALVTQKNLNSENLSPELQPIEVALNGREITSIISNVEDKLADALETYTLSQIKDGGEALTEEDYARILNDMNIEEILKTEIENKFLQQFQGPASKATDDRLELNDEIRRSTREPVPRPSAGPPPPKNWPGGPPPGGQPPGGPPPGGPPPGGPPQGRPSSIADYESGRSGSEYSRSLSDSDSDRS